MALPALTPTQALSLLETAQLDPSTLPSALRHLSLSLSRPHPSVTHALFDLVQLEPHATLPYLPTLISATSADVTRAVHLFSEALSADRTLLVPVIAALAQLPLPYHVHLETRATLSFALHVVDHNDLPAVVRAIAHICSNDRHSARWAAFHIRRALNRVVDHHVINVLILVLREICVPGNCTGTALTQSRARDMSWVDLVTCILATDFARVKAIVAMGGLDAVLDSLHVLNGLDGVTDGVVAFVRNVGKVVSGVHQIVQFVRLVKRLLQIVPQAREGILAELITMHVVGEVCVVSAAKLFGKGVSVWNNPWVRARVEEQVVVKVRKGVWGPERSFWMQVANEVVAKEPAVVDAVVGREGAMQVVGRAVMEGGRSVWIDGWGVAEGAVDVGAILERDVKEISIVVPALIVGKDGVDGLVGVSVLVPQDCLGFYEGVEQWEGDYGGVGYEEKGGDVAVLAFEAGISVLVGTLRLLGRRLNVCSRALERRGETLLEEEKRDRRMLWEVVERLFELDRMLNALVAASEGGKEGSMKDAVLKSVFLSEKGRDFPRVSLGGVLFALTSLPDELDIRDSGKVAACELMRDVELARLDKLFLRLLLRYLLGSKKNVRGGGKDEEELWDRMPEKEAGCKEEVLQDSDLDKLEMHISGLLSKGQDLDDIDDIYYCDDSDKEEPNGKAQDKESNHTSSIESEYVPQFTDGHVEYLRSATACLGFDQDKLALDERQAADVIHSPQFAALLLDRAATYAAVAKRAHRGSVGDVFLSIVTPVAGIALRCLSHILRLVTLWPEALEEDAMDLSVGRWETECMRQYLKAMNEHLMVVVPENDSCDFNVPEDIARCVHALRWISYTAVDAAVASLAIDVLLVICEHGCIPMTVGRLVALESLTTIYEHDSKKIWLHDDLSLALNDSFAEWSLRRRGSKYNAADDECDKAPWIDMSRQSAHKDRIVSTYRLSLIFGGMHQPLALREGAAWLREMIAMIKQPGDDDHVREVKSSDAFHAQQGEGEEIAKVNQKKHDTTKCSILLDMVGYRDVLTALLMLVQNVLEEYLIPDHLDPQDAANTLTSPLIHIEGGLNLFRGILHLFYKNRQGAQEAQVGCEGSMDATLDRFMLLAIIPMLQLVRARISDVFGWYSSESTDVSQLAKQTVKTLESIVGNSAQIVTECLDISKVMKMPLPNGETQNVTPQKQKNAGSAMMKQKRIQGMKEESFSRRKNHIPRLIAQCELMMTDVLKLAKAMGLRGKRRLTKFASAPKEMDESLYFGIGLESNAWSMDHECEERVDEVDDNPSQDEEEEEDNVDEEEGFHVRRQDEEEQVDIRDNTVTIHFSR